MMFRKMVLPILGVLCLTVGCGDGVKPGRGVPVSGRVTMGGKPLEGAVVTFMNDTFAGTGRTDAEGNYKLVQGAAPGNNKVTISKVEGDASAPGALIPGGVQSDAESGLDAGQAEAASMAAPKNKAAGPKELVPSDYSNPAATKLTYDIPADGAADVNFDL